MVKTKKKLWYNTKIIALLEQGSSFQLSRSCKKGASEGQGPFEVLEYTQQPPAQVLLQKNALDIGTLDIGTMGLLDSIHLLIALSKGI